MTVFSLLVVLVGTLGGILFILIGIFMKLSDLSTTLNAASDTLDAILLRLPVMGDPELGAANEAAVARLNDSVASLNRAVLTPPPV